MPEYEEILRVKEEAEATLRSLPGVHAVGIGNKVVDGKITEETAIAAFVIKKKPLSELAGNQVVPAEINGIKTDVVEMPLPRFAFAANPSNLTYEKVSDGISFSGDAQQKPGDGLVLIIDFTVSPPPAAGVPNSAVTYETGPHDTLEIILKNLVNSINHSGLNVTATTPLNTSIKLQGTQGTQPLLQTSMSCKLMILNTLKTGCGAEFKSNREEASTVKQGRWAVLQPSRQRLITHRAEWLE